jgi:hypothetical protein
MNRQRVRITASTLLIALTVGNPVTLPLAVVGIWTLRREWRRRHDSPTESGAHRRSR